MLRTEEERAARIARHLPPGAGTFLRTKAPPSLAEIPQNRRPEIQESLAIRALRSDPELRAAFDAETARARKYKALPTGSQGERQKRGTRLKRELDVADAQGSRRHLRGTNPEYVEALDAQIASVQGARRGVKTANEKQLDAIDAQREQILGTDAAFGQAHSRDAANVRRDAQLGARIARRRGTTSSRPPSWIRNEDHFIADQRARGRTNEEIARAAAKFRERNLGIKPGDIEKRRAQQIIVDADDAIEAGADRRSRAASALARSPEVPQGTRQGLKGTFENPAIAERAKHSREVREADLDIEAGERGLDYGRRVVGRLGSVHDARTALGLPAGRTTGGIIKYPKEKLKVIRAVAEGRRNVDVGVPHPKDPEKIKIVDKHVSEIVPGLGGKDATNRQLAIDMARAKTELNSTGTDFNYFPGDVEPTKAAFRAIFGKTEVPPQFGHRMDPDKLSSPEPKNFYSCA